MPVVRRQISGNGSLTLASIFEAGVPTAFQMNNTIGLTPNGGGVIPLATGNKGLYQGTGKVLRIRAVGTIQGVDADDNPTITFRLYQVPASVTAAGLSATSFTGWNLVASSSAISVPVTITNNGAVQTLTSWSFDARLQMDSDGDLTGEFTDAINGGTVDAWQATSIITGYTTSGYPVFSGFPSANNNINGNESDLNFVMVVVPGGTPFSLVSATMNEFAINDED